MPRRCLFGTDGGNRHNPIRQLPYTGGHRSTLALRRSTSHVANRLWWSELERVALLRVRLHDARPGMKLALPVYHPQTPGQVLLRSGFELTDEVLERLLSLRVRVVWVGYPGLERLAERVSVDVQEAQVDVVRKVIDVFSQSQSQATARLDYSTYTQSVAQLVDQLVANPKSAIFLGDLADCQGQDLLRHSSSVTYLSALVGLKLEGYLVKQRRHVDPARAKSVINLGLGAMLHDLGVTRLPQEVREHYERTGDESDPDWQDHPRLGFVEARTRVEASAATVILNHHQRLDGSGYAGRDMPRLEGERIHVFARIVSLVDQFDRWRFDPAIDQPRTTVEALSMLLAADQWPRFDKQAMAALLAVVPPYPPGTMVQLCDGRWALVVDHDPAHPCRPLVQEMPDPSQLQDAQGPLGEPFHLRDAPATLFVARADDTDVAGFNFVLPEYLISDTDVQPRMAG
jgi:HD-GYP domain-containing protein (c-di-GMP phosphodiesterase class II)